MSSPSPAPSSRLALTGERTLPGIADERYWFERHVVAYDLAGTSVTDAVVLDAGCGEGYGLRLLRRAGAAEAVGVDVDAAVVDHITETYCFEDAATWALESDLTDLPFPAALFDHAVSFQVIEHLADVPAFLRELQRVVKPGGTVWIATPNRLTFTPDSDVPLNPFHITEFAPDELRVALTNAGLSVEQLLGVHHGDELRRAEAALGVSLPSLLTAGPPESWSDELRNVVHRVEASWFELREDDLDTSLDLIAVCTVPAAAER